MATQDSTTRAEGHLLRGAAVYAIGMFANNALSVLLLPLITRLLTPEEYGYYDIVLSTVTLIVPLLTLQSLEALFRLLFSADARQKKTYVTIIFCVCTAGLAAGMAAFAVFTALNPQVQFPVQTALYTVSLVTYLFYQKVARAQGENKLYARVGIAQTALLLFSQLFLLLVFRMKADALLLAAALSFAVGSAIFERRLHVAGLVSFKLLNNADLRRILRFSVPLIPNTISWWLIASLNRYLLLGAKGMEEVGIYSMALKFSFLVTAIAQVFNMAWQESAIAEHQSEHPEEAVFHSRAFHRFMQLLLSLVCVLIPATRVVLPYVVGAHFLAAGSIIPPLYVTAVLEAFMTFWSAGYFVHQRTSGAFFTTLTGALANIALVLLLIGRWGMLAPVIGAMAAFLVIWLLRIYTLRTVLQIRIDLRMLALLAGLVCLFGAGYYLLPAAYDLPMLLAAMACAVLINRDWLLALWKRLVSQKNGSDR